MGMQHKGFSIVEALQPCPTFNKDITGEWLKERVYTLENNYGLLLIKRGLKLAI